MQRIVAGVDDSDGSMKAAWMAGQLAAELTVVHVRHAPPRSWSPMLPDSEPGATQQAIEELTRRRVAQTLEPLDLNWTLQVCEGAQWTNSTTRPATEAPTCWWLGADGMP